MTDNKGFGSEKTYPRIDDVITTIEGKNSIKANLENALSARKHMIPSKIVYGLAGGYTGSFVPFINIFLTSIGLSVSEAGIIGGIRLVSSTILGPIWGLIIDYTGRRKLVYSILCIGTTFTIFSLPWTAQYIITNKNYTLLINGSIVNHNNNIPVKLPYGFTSPLFNVMLFTIFFSNIFDVPLQGVIDSFVMNVAHSREKYESFGMQKVYHSVFFGIANFVAGLSADHYKHSENMSKYTAIFFVFIPCVILLIPTGFILLKQTRWDSKEKQPQNSSTNISKVKTVLTTFSNLDNVIFILSVFLVGVASAVLLGFLFMLMDHEVHASKSSMGLSVLISCIVQILTFPFSDKIIKKIGTITCIELALMTYFIRFMLVSYIVNQWLVLPTQLFHCFGFALFWAAAIEHVQYISPKEIYCTMYCILTSVYYGLGGILGNMAGGFIFTHYGGRLLFRGTAILCLVWLVIMVLYYHVYKRFMNKQTFKS